jgi:hypothetical protein
MLDQAFSLLCELIAIHIPVPSRRFQKQLLIRARKGIRRGVELERSDSETKPPQFFDCLPQLSLLPLQPFKSGFPVADDRTHFQCPPFVLQASIVTQLAAIHSNFANGQSPPFSLIDSAKQQFTFGCEARQLLRPRCVSESMTSVGD